MGERASSTLQTLDDRVKTLVKQTPAYEEILVFYGAILREQLGARENFDPKMPPEINKAADEKEKRSPSLLGEKIPLDFEGARRLFRSLCRVAKRQNKTLREGIEKIEHGVREEKIALDRLLEEATVSETPYAEKVSSSLGLSHDILIFLARASIQPFLEKTAIHLKERIDCREWSQGTCPLCGSAPILSALLGEEGKRVWICSLCGHQWQASRTACPFCEREDPKAHRYLFVEKDETARVDVCGMCNKYLKTIDLRKMGTEIFPLLEYMRTIHLDILAQEAGYESGSPPPLLDIR
jgi:FdhE protein